MIAAIDDTVLQQATGSKLPTTSAELAETLAALTAFVAATEAAEATFEGYPWLSVVPVEVHYSTRNYSALSPRLESRSGMPLG
ncbi:hypothetical protein [Agromyces archimandritae]|uniref:Uncharacterized protein n=1 Tax=Agromyces archimandritae TaxID=2781962 RepID=A0A975FNW9_9MICO|nr:hypothetical protein [Agromyces archimandritae]QTX05650.1 hypothetical protein G127AT_05445 [Agromyces archimandritae]